MFIKDDVLDYEELGPGKWLFKVLKYGEEGFRPLRRSKGSQEVSTGKRVQACAISITRPPMLGDRRVQG